METPHKVHTREAITANTAHPDHDLKTEEQTSYTWGRREAHTEKDKWAEL